MGQVPTGTTTRRQEVPVVLVDQGTSSRQSGYWIPNHSNTTILILRANLNGRVEEGIAVQSW